MDEERKSGPSISDLISAAQTAKTFATIAPIAIPIIIGVIVFFIVLSTPGLSGQQAETVTITPLPSTNPIPKGNVKFYCQYDPKWTSSECNITTNGCDPTSIAIILASFGDKDWTPDKVAHRNGGMGCFGPTSKNQTVSALSWVKTLGYKVAGFDPDEEGSGYLLSDVADFNFLRARKFLDAGYLIHAGAVVTFKSNGIKRGGHSFVITDVSPASKEITAYDPTYCFSDSDSGLRTISPSDLGDGTGNTWFWAFPVKKEGFSQLR